MVFSIVFGVFFNILICWVKLVLKLSLFFIVCWVMVVICVDMLSLWVILFMFFFVINVEFILNVIILLVGSGCGLIKKLNCYCNESLCK